MRSFAYVGALVLVAAVAAVPCRAADQPPPPQMTTVKVGVTDRPDNAALTLAYRRGYFEKQGIAIEFVGGGAAAQDFVSALGLNQIQVTAGSPSAGLFNALNRGINIRIVADWSHVGGADDATFALVARSDLMDAGTIKVPADLKGRAIGVGPQHGAFNDILIAGALKLGGLSLGDADLEIMGFADGIPAMTSHRLDATELIEPLVTLAEQKGIARVLVPAGAVDPAAELAVVYFSPEFAKDADLATRYLAAFLQGERDYADAFIDNKDRDAAIAILVQDLSVKDPKLWATARPQHVDLNGEINVASLKTQAAFYKAEGAISGAIPDIDKYVDPQFAAAAVKLIGRR